jgi:hypothetical protein
MSSAALLGCLHSVSYAAQPRALHLTCLFRKNNRNPPNAARLTVASEIFIWKKFLNLPARGLEGSGFEVAALHGAAGIGKASDREEFAATSKPDPSSQPD